MPIPANYWNRLTSFVGYAQPVDPDTQKQSNSQTVADHKQPVDQKVTSVKENHINPSNKPLDSVQGKVEEKKFSNLYQVTPPRFERLRQLLNMPKKDEKKEGKGKRDQGSLQQDAFSSNSKQDEEKREGTKREQKTTTNAPTTAPVATSQAQPTPTLLNIPDTSPQAGTQKNSAARPTTPSASEVIKKTGQVTPTSISKLKEKQLKAQRWASYSKIALITLGTLGTSLPIGGLIYYLTQNIAMGNQNSGTSTQNNNANNNGVVGALPFYGSVQHIIPSTTAIVTIIGLAAIGLGIYKYCISSREDFILSILSKQTPQTPAGSGNPPPATETPGSAPGSGAGPLPPSSKQTQGQTVLGDTTKENEKTQREDGSVPLPDPSSSPPTHTPRPPIPPRDSRPTLTPTQPSQLQTQTDSVTSSPPPPPATPLTAPPTPPPHTPPTPPRTLPPTPSRRDSKPPLPNPQPPQTSDDSIPLPPAVPPDPVHGSGTGPQSSPSKEDETPANPESSSTDMAKKANRSLPEVPALNDSAEKKRVDLKAAQRRSSPANSRSVDNSNRRASTPTPNERKKLNRRHERQAHTPIDDVSSANEEISPLSGSNASTFGTGSSSSIPASTSTPSFAQHGVDQTKQQKKLRALSETVKNDEEIDSIKAKKIETEILTPLADFALDRLSKAPLGAALKEKVDGITRSVSDNNIRDIQIDVFTQYKQQQPDLKKIEVFFTTSEAATGKAQLSASVMPGSHPHSEFLIKRRKSTTTNDDTPEGAKLEILKKGIKKCIPLLPDFYTESILYLKANQEQKQNQGEETERQVNLYRIFTSLENAITLISQYAKNPELKTSKQEEKPVEKSKEDWQVKLESFRTVKTKEAFNGLFAEFFDPVLRLLGVLADPKDGPKKLRNPQWVGANEDYQLLNGRRLSVRGDAKEILGNNQTVFAGMNSKGINALLQGMEMIYDGAVISLIKFQDAKKSQKRDDDIVLDAGAVIRKFTSLKETILSKLQPAADNKQPDPVQQQRQPDPIQQQTAQQEPQIELIGTSPLQLTISSGRVDDVIEKSKKILENKDLSATQMGKPIVLTGDWAQ